MKRPWHRLPAALLALALVLGSGALAAPESKPRIMILATGGTIAGAQASAAEAGYKSGTFSVDDLIKAVPKLKDLAEISGEQVANIGSQTMTHEVWLKLAQRIDEIHYAREAQKTNSTQLDTFKSPNRGRAGVMNTGRAFFFYPNNAKHTTKSEFSVDGVQAKDLPRVEIVYSYANFGRDIIDYLVSNGAKGLVLAGVGDGNSTDVAIAALAEAAKKGVAVVRATRTGSGLVVRNVEVEDDKLGFIASMELNPQKSRILLMLGLLKTNDPKRLQEYFMEY